MLRLFLNHLRRSWKLGLLTILGTFAFQMVALKVFQSIVTGPQAAQAGMLGRLMPRWMQTAMGIDGPITSLPTFLTVIYQHPFLLAIVLAAPIAAASTFLAGEVERRTLALLLARPVSRLQVVLSTALVCVLWPALTCAAAWLGTWAGVRWTGVAPPEWREVTMVALNLYLLAFATAGFAVLVSSLVVEKSDAVGWCVTVLLGMYVGNFLVEMYPEAARVGPFLLFHYYSPSDLLRANPTAAANPAGVLAWNAQFLGAVGVIGSVLGAIVFSRKPINL